MKFASKRLTLSQQKETFDTPPNPYASGYGNRIPTRFMIRLPNERVWRRVYCVCYSNIGTLYVFIKRVPHIVGGFK